VLASRGIVSGIKVDTGARPLALAPGETVTEGLDGLRDRLAEYRGMGARFAKWRAVIHIADGQPSRACVSANAHALARYAALCQDASLVPIVEPEVLMDGSHSIERCEEVTTMVLQAVFQALFEQRVALESMLLKPNMVVPGKASPRPASVPEVATATLRCLLRTVPAAVRPSRCRAGDVARARREGEGRPGGAVASGPVQRSRQSRPVHRRHGGQPGEPGATT
jgi:fructose-bisphosphate aldolase class I